MHLHGPERTAEPIRNLRIRLYGTQGSGSTYPSLPEREAFREKSDYDLLQRVFQDLAKNADPGSGRLHCTIDEILGGPPDHRTLLAYRGRLAPPEPVVFGGWTTCAHVETADGYDIVLDCGSGFRNCARDLQVKWDKRPTRDLHVFGSHSHLDHTEGFEQAAVCFDRRNTIHIYGNRQFLRALDSNLGIFTRHVSDELKGVQTPIFYAIMPTKFRATEIRPTEATDAGAAAARPHDPLATDALAQSVHPMNEPVVLGGTTVTPFEVFHPAPCLGYRVEHGGKVFVFCTDHELRRGPDAGHPAQVASLEAERRVREHSVDADLLYRDGQYLHAEYAGEKGIGRAGPASRLDWGHSCLEDVMDMARECRVKRVLIGHHDPNREWSERNWLDGTLRRASADLETRVELARAETVVDL